jgi:hypothetical protein
MNATSSRPGLAESGSQKAVRGERRRRESAAATNANVALAGSGTAVAKDDDDAPDVLNGPPCARRLKSIAL